MNRRQLFSKAIFPAGISLSGLSPTDAQSSAADLTNDQRARFGELPPTSLPKNHRLIQLKVGALERNALVYVPTSARSSQPSNKPLPLVIMLHGMGGSASAAMNETSWSAKAEVHGFIVVYPEATRPDETKAPDMRGNARAWNDGSGRFHAGERQIDDLGFIDALISSFLDSTSEIKVDPRRIYVTGFSNGASMTFRIGATLANRVTAIAPNAGACWTPVLNLANKLSVCYITGTNDSLNPLEGGVPRLAQGSQDQSGLRKPSIQATIDKWVRANRFELVPDQDELKDGVRLRRYRPTGSNNQGEVRYITVEGLGHHWAGGKSQAPEWLVGKNSNRLTATDAVWEFFEAQVRV
jgi:polyhydroxybutyrate depolymerase